MDYGILPHEIQRHRICKLQSLASAIALSCLEICLRSLIEMNMFEARGALAGKGLEQAVPTLLAAFRGDTVWIDVPQNPMPGSRSRLLAEVAYNWPNDALVRLGRLEEGSKRARASKENSCLLPP
jgi:hypothetical protein